ncbi:lipoate--protein ligase family protein [Candidatus Halobonum tyrrellensis]|uniref:Biotin/lipoate A/B protein ligase n=1 Tax=Candidatus Halobonum tyrrellensis G22 TaxID=1324957 RepID=V4HAF5_9EURY|nr:biotin/lipoate A/B protein ligase family protein [Candidatus Halobonum tyrrellensis]ESP87690.1 biotin/lipoate A/B protein ligase [Candidatus Halobonum tyrrellensis G22]
MEPADGVPDGEWRLIREEARPGPLNMALDEVAAETAAAGGPRTVRVYRWAPSCLSLGYHQDPDTVDWDGCRTAGVDVTRRQTGGGGIYHDSAGDISYSIAAPADELPGDLLDAYHLLCTPVLDAFARLGVDAGYADEERPAVYQPACYLRGLHPAHDVLSGGGGGRKLSGNAQYRRDDAVIQHGSVTYESLPDAHLGCFADSGVSAAEFRERVVGIAELTDASRAEAVAAFEGALGEWAGADEGAWTDAELDRAEAIADEKYRADEWVRRDPGGR